MTNRATMNRQGRAKGERPRARYHFYLDDDIDEYLGKLARQRWRGHQAFSTIIRQIIREYRDAAMDLSYFSPSAQPMRPGFDEALDAAVAAAKERA